MSHRGTRLAGGRVLVTGGGSGLGRQMALQAAAAGAHLTVWDLNDEAAARVCQEILTAGGRARAQHVDVTDGAAVTAAASACGEVDVLINNAGIVTGRPLLEADEPSIRRTFEVNTLSLYWVTRAFLPGMLERNRGTVVTLASAAGLVGVARQTDYAASKFAAVGFTESLRAELAAVGSRVSTLLVCPYYIDTGMFDGVRTKWPHLLPILHQDQVARAVLHAVQTGRQQIVLPRLVRFLPGLRLLPVGGFDAAMSLLGVNHTMDHFVGRRPAENPR